MPPRDDPARRAALDDDALGADDVVRAARQRADALKQAREMLGDAMPQQSEQCDQCEQRGPTASDDGPADIDADEREP